MNWTVLILPRAQRELDSLDHLQYPRVRDAMLTLATDPRPPGCRKLTGRDGWRIRAGDYRVLYEIDDQRREVLVVHVGHRRDDYR